MMLSQKSVRANHKAERVFMVSIKKGFSCLQNCS